MRPDGGLLRGLGRSSVAATIVVDIRRVPRDENVTGIFYTAYVIGERWRSDMRNGYGARWLAPGVIVLASTVLVAGCGPDPAARAASLEAWNDIEPVLTHPRCLNCHQMDTPLQGNEPRPHVPMVVRGPGNHGVSAMQCGNCHNQSGNNPTSGVPGAPHWSLAPESMLWQGLSSGELCRMLIDETRNGGRSPEALIEHMGQDPLVLWGWDPGADREPVPIGHEQFMQIVETWVAGGSACPG